MDGLENSFAVQRRQKRPLEWIFASAIPHSKDEADASGRFSIGHFGANSFTEIQIIQFHTVSKISEDILEEF